MAKYVLKRLMLLIPVVIGITFFIYVIMSVAPGDPARLILGENATLEEIEAKRIELGLDKPLVLRYINYMGGVLRGDLGISWYSGFNVMQEFLSRLPNTITLGLLSNLITVYIGIPLGILAAQHQYGPIDYTTLVIAMLFSSMPAFWFGLMAQIYLSINLQWFPATGAGDFYHFILPAITLSTGGLAGQVRLTRTSILEVNKLDYVRTARSKGCTENQIVLHHVLRNALLPVITSVGGHFATLLGGAIVPESVFAIPGVASLMINAVKVRDVPVVMGVIVFISVFVGVVNLLVDLCYAAVDPRVKLSA